MKLKLVIFLFIFKIVWASPFDLSNLEESEGTEEVSKETDKVLEVFEEKQEADLIILDIKNGIKSVIIISKGPQKIYKDLTITLDKCWLEKDPFYKKISLAEVRINLSDYKISSLTPKIIENQYLVSIKCK